MKKHEFRKKSVAAAVGLAMAAPFMIGTALAANPGNVPVNGTLKQGSVSVTVTGTTDTLGSTNTAALAVTLNSTVNVINWGNPNTAATLNPNSTLAGFNIGTKSSVDFTTTQSSTVAVLNVDTSGQPSTLDGSLTGTNVNVFVANANGIVVGSTADLSAPVLGLIASNVDNTALTSAAPQIALSFATAGSISVANGANLNGNSANAVLIAGAGTVNVAGTSTANISSNLVVDGGVSGLYNSSTATFTAASSVGNVNLTTAPTNVNLNLGTAGGTFPLSTVYAFGDITNNGNVSLAASPQFTGTLTNNGIINQSSAGTLLSIGGVDGLANIYANTTAPSSFGSVVNNGTIAAANGFNLNIAGTFTNSTNAQLNVTGAATMADSGFNNAGLVSVAAGNGNAGDFSNTNGSFTNSGTISVDGSFAVNNAASFNNSGTITVADNSTTPDNVINASGTVSNTGTMTFGNNSTGSVNLSVSDANFSNTGTLNLVTNTGGSSNLTVSSFVSGTLAGTFSAPTLKDLSFTAGTYGPSGTTPGNIAQINTNDINASGTVALAGYNVDLNSSVIAGGTATVAVGGAASPQLGALTVASGATLGGSTVNINAYSQGFANVALAGNISGKSVNFGTSKALNNIQGAGSISSPNVFIAATGNVTNPSGGGSAANGYLKNGLIINGPSTVTVDAVGPIAQNWNLKVLGNATFQSNTNNFTTSGLNNGASSGLGSSYYSPAANAGSHLLMSASGSLTINGLASQGLGTSGDTGTFYFPGLVVAYSNGNMSVVGNLNNAVGATGQGILLNSSQSLAVQGNIYTNGNSGVNYWVDNGGTVSVVGNLYNVYEPTNVSTGVRSYANEPYLYGNIAGANPAAGGAKKVNLIPFFNR